MTDRRRRPDKAKYTPICVSTHIIRSPDPILIQVQDNSCCGNKQRNRTHVFQITQNRRFRSRDRQFIIARYGDTRRTPIIQFIKLINNPIVNVLIHTYDDGKSDTNWR